MADPVLSIVVPVFNVEEYFPTCVDSLLAQTFTDFELILVDDGSPDGCPAMCDKYASRDSRVRVLHQANSGPQAAVIAGVHLARGTYIGFVDGDDWVSPDMFEHLLLQMLGTDAEIAQCGYRMMSPGGSRGDYAASPELSVYDGTFIRETLAPQLLTFFQFDDPLMVPARWNKVFSRDLILRNIRYLDTRVRMGEDLNMTLPALLDAKRVACVSEYSYNYRLNERSATRSPMAGLWPQVVTLYDALIRICTDKAPELTTHANAYYNYMTLLAVVNTTLVSPGLAAPASEIREILNQNRMHSDLRLLGTENMSFTLRMVHRLLLLNLVPAVPAFLRARDALSGCLRLLSVSSARVPRGRA